MSVHPSPPQNHVRNHVDFVVIVFFVTFTRGGTSSALHLIAYLRGHTLLDRVETLKRVFARDYRVSSRSFKLVPGDHKLISF
jgi:hypothetical protein